MSNRAWVTLATNDSYGLGALVLAHSLRRAGSTHSTVVLITPSVTDAMRDRLRAVFTEVVTVDVLDSRDAAHLALLQRPELGITFTKIHCWGLTQYEKCVFLDADTLVVQNCDELFEREELSAAPDVGWPDCFNSGVFVFKPSTETFDALIKFAQERGSFDGGDQGLLNSFFSDWARGDINKHLPFLYNVTSAAFYSYLPALKHYGQDLKIIHFIGAAKPWLQPYNWSTRSVSAPDHLQGLLQLWWDLFVGQVHHQLDASMVEDVEVEAAPAPPPDVAQHYAPSLDPQSEFRWHHPDAQIHDEPPERIETTDFHDPWQHYRGNIPANPQLEATDDRQAVRDYAREYSAPAQSPDEWHRHDTNWHNEPHNHTHSHDHTDHQGDHYTHTHGYPPEHRDWCREHEAGSVFTSHDHSQHHSVHDHHGHHTQYPHDHHHDHTEHPHHDHSNSERPQSHAHEPHDSHDHKGFGHDQVKYVTDHSRVHNVHIVHHVHVDYENTPNDENREADVPVAIRDMNGDASDTESCHDHEDIKPRHPYDNYYLKHRAAIDPYGRKICSHEIPPPPPSPPPESVASLDSEEEFYEAEVEIQVSDNLSGGRPHHEIIHPERSYSYQSGVAGTLARVTPGAAASEALDELTRRQGWEAGNIDYMGADSFDNIWAKISQTLNRPTQSPPKQPSPPKEPAPKQPSPPKEPTPKQTSLPKEPAPKQPSPPKEPTPKQPSPPKEVKVEAPVEAPAVEAAGEPAPSAPAPAAEAPQAKTDKPEVPPTPPTPKSTPEPSTPVAEVPAIAEALLAASPAPAPASPAPASPVPASPAPASPAPASPVPASPASAVAAPASLSTTPEKGLDATSACSDSPPLAHTPSKEDAPTDPSKSEERERRRPERLQLSPPAAADPLATPDSELEDAAALAHAIIASELTPEPARAPPAVSLAQIGVKPKASTAELIESSVAPAGAEAPPAPMAQTPATPSTEAPATPKTEAPITPKAESPATPKAEVSATPKTEAPATPKAEASPTPKAQAPATPKIEAPATPKVEAPATPKMEAPATKKAEAPALPKADAPATAKIEAPATPKAEAPATPKADAPATPKIEGPTTPKAEAPATPKAEAPATPKAQAPTTLKAEATATPKTEAPATPKAEAPATPKAETPVTPIKTNAPATPKAEAPATPVAVAAAAAASTTKAPATPETEAPASPTADAPPKDAPKKKLVKKVVKKEGDAPVPPPRKKEKKPKEK